MLYGHILLVIGIILPILALNSHLDKSYSEMFYIYLLLCSICYLMFVQIDLLYLK